MPGEVRLVLTPLFSDNPEAVTIRFEPTPHPAAAQPAKAAQGAFVLNNWNEGGCELTDKIRFTMASRIAIDQLNTWINWPAGVTSTGYTVRKNGTAVYQGRLKRGRCHPEKPSWCYGTDSWKLRLFDPGTYEITTDIARVCRNAASNDNGYVSLRRASNNGGDTADEANPKPGSAPSGGADVLSDLVRWFAGN